VEHTFFGTTTTYNKPVGLSVEGDITIPLTPECIALGIQDRTLMPSTALLLITLQGNEMLTSAGGPSQLQYLSELLTSWQKLCGRFGNTVSNSKDSIWCGDNVLFQTVTTEDTSSTLATLIDLFLYEDNHNTAVDTALASTSIAETVDAILPVLYGIYTKQKLQQNFGYTIPKLFLS
jgi:hypothetical protein